MKLSTNRIIGVYAPPNYGKTYLMRWLLTYIAPKVPVFVYDTNFERTAAYSGLNENIQFIKSPKVSEQATPKFLNKAILYLRSHYSNFYLVIEDIDKLIDTPSKTKDTLEIFKIASDNRHQRIGLIYASKTPTNIPVILRSSTSLFFFGSFIEPAFTKYIGQMIDKKKLSKIKSPEFIMLDRDTREEYVVQIKDNAMEKVD